MATCTCLAKGRKHLAGCPRRVKVPCRHCTTRRAAQHKRGLCHACYCTPEIRAQYPSLSRYGNRGTTPAVLPAADRPRTLQEIGDLFGLTRQRVRCIAHGAVLKMMAALRDDPVIQQAAADEFGEAG